MKLLLIIIAGLASFSQLYSQVFAIVTVDVSNPAEDDARFVIELDTENAPLNIANFMMLADPEVSHYRNSGNATLLNNPSGSYKPSDENGVLLASGQETFSIAMNGSPSPNIAPVEGDEAIVFRTQTVNPVATFRYTSGSWVHEKGPFDSFDFTLTYNNTFFRWALEVDTNISYLNETTGEITSGPFYDNEGALPVLNLGTTNPYLSLGKRELSVNQPPGWFIQNEMIRTDANSMDDAGVFGTRFANLGGTVGASQRYAVACANSSLRTPNTASSEIFITGITGNPDFESRHTYIGEIVFGSYKNTNLVPNTIIPNSRGLVDSILTGNRTPILKSIRFENWNPASYHPLDEGPFLPLISSGIGTPELDLSPLTGPRVLTGSTAGQVRYVDGSLDLVSWSRVGQSSYPTSASEETGLPIDISGAATRQFFRISPTIITYPDWPSDEFDFTGRTLRFKGREIDVDGAPQVLNNFIITFDSTLQAGELVGDGGDLNGVHQLTNVVYTATSPFAGEITMDSVTLPDPLKFRLYFDAHKTIEYTEETIIDRFHRLTDQIVSTPAGDILFPDAIQEFGIWTIVN